MLPISNFLDAALHICLYEPKLDNAKEFVQITFKTVVHRLNQIKNLGILTQEDNLSSTYEAIDANEAPETLQTYLITMSYYTIL